MIFAKGISLGGVMVRSVTHRYPVGDMTKLDLKDYDRQGSPLQKNEMDMSRSDFLPKHQFHPMIPQNVWLSFSQEAYGSVVFEAFKQVEIAVREVGVYESTNRLHISPTDLIRQSPSSSSSAKPK